MLVQEFPSFKKSDTLAELAGAFAELAGAFAELTGSYAELSEAFAELAVAFANLAGVFAEFAGAFAELAEAFAELVGAFAVFTVDHTPCPLSKGRGGCYCQGHSLWKRNACLTVCYYIMRLNFSVLMYLI